MKNKILIYTSIIFFTLLSITAWFLYMNNKFYEFKIKDCTKDSIFFLPKNIDHPFKCKVILKGTIDGRALINEDTIEAGEVNKIIYYGDWYDEPFSIEYINLSVQNGELKLFYRFD